MPEYTSLVLAELANLLLLDHASELVDENAARRAVLGIIGSDGRRYGVIAVFHTAITSRSRCGDGDWLSMPCTADVFSSALPVIQAGSNA